MEKGTVDMQTSHLLERVFNTADGVFAVDEGQRIIFWNRGAEAILGYSPEEVVGKRCFELIQGIDEAGRASCAQSCSILCCARQGKLSTGQNLWVRAKNGAPHWLSVTHTFVDAGDNHFTVLVHIFRDVTAEVEAKRLMQRIAEQLSSYSPHQGAEGAGPGSDPALTEREKQVLGLLAQGDGTSAIARKLTISNTTARNHTQNLLAKLGVHTRLEAVAYAQRHRLVEPGLASQSPGKAFQMLGEHGGRNEPTFG
jgi:PAS domain S-box-containing protein